MLTVTIPKKLAKKDDLIVLPRKEYEALLQRSKNKDGEKLEENLIKILNKATQGKIKGPFRSVKSLKESLEK